VEAGYESQLVAIGLILKTVGYQGGLLIDTYPEYGSTWNLIHKCLIRVDGVWAPFFIVSKEIKSEGLLVLFEDLQDNKLAKSLIHQEIFILNSQLTIEIPPADEQDEINAWTGYTIYDIHTDFAAIIDRVEELPSQLLAFVTYKGKSIVLPLAEELIVELDPDNKSMKMDLPSGLLEL